MKIVVDDVPLFEINETQKKVMANDIHKDILHEDILRRLQWVIAHKYQECFKRLKNEWDPKLKTNGVKSVPTDEDGYANLVFSQWNYKDKAERNKQNTGV